MKEFFINQLKKSLSEFTAKKFNETYQAGLGDIRGPKPMKLKFFKDKVECSYMDGLRLKSFTINPADIVELDMRVEAVNTTGSAITGAIAGNLIAGSLGAIAMANSASRNNKQDVLHLVIKYYGEDRSLVLQTSKNTHEIYRLLKGLK